MRTATAAAILLMLCAGARAQAVTLTECGRLDGYSFYFSGGLVPADKGGWKKDSIVDGRIILNFINGDVDLLIKNSTGSTGFSKASWRENTRSRNEQPSDCPECLSR